MGIACARNFYHKNSIKIISALLCLCDYYFDKLSAPSPDGNHYPNRRAITVGCE
jgi:hypothetical protein